MISTLVEKYNTDEKVQEMVEANLVVKKRERIVQ